MIVFIAVFVFIDVLVLVVILVSVHRVSRKRFIFLLHEERRDSHHVFHVRFQWDFPVAHRSDPVTMAEILDVERVWMTSGHEGVDVSRELCEYSKRFMITSRTG